MGWVPTPAPQAYNGDWLVEDIEPLTEDELKAILATEDELHEDWPESNPSMREGEEYAVRRSREAKKAAHANDGPHPTAEEEREERIQARIERAKELKALGVEWKDPPEFDQRVEEWMTPEEVAQVEKIKAEFKEGLHKEIEVTKAGAIEPANFPSESEIRHQAYPELSTPNVVPAPAPTPAPGPVPQNKGLLAAKIGQWGALGVGGLVLGTMTGIVLYKFIKGKLEEAKKPKKGKEPAKKVARMKRRHEREWVSSD
jgi:hypothetical protein